jgi:L-asparaginase II
VVDQLSDRELSVGAASHHGEPAHCALVTGLLGRFGLPLDGLQCGAHAPSHGPSARLVPTPTALHNNCSGKHTFMLAASRAQGWDADYRPIDHPLQVANHALIDTLAGVRHGWAVDGCSIPTFFAPLSAQARAWGALASAMATGDGALARIGWAMQREPWCMSGTGRLDLAVVEQAPEPVACKIGAEGLFCIALPARRAGLAVKVHSGSTDALAVGVRAVLAELGVVLGGAWSWSEVRNVRGAAVGDRRAEWS